MGHGHKHDHHHHHTAAALHDIAKDKAAYAKTRRALGAALTVTAGFMVVETIGGIAANSLALLSDAVHMFADSAALALALLAVWVSNHPRTARRFRNADLWGAFANGLWVLALAFFLAWEAVQRLQTPGGEPIDGQLVFVVGILGLGVNILSVLFLKTGARGDLNIRAALLHVLVDILGSFAALVSGVVVWATGWMPIDGVVTVLMSVLIVWNGGGLLRDTWRERRRRLLGMSPRPPEIH